MSVSSGINSGVSGRCISSRIYCCRRSRPFSLKSTPVRAGATSPAPSVQTLRRRSRGWNRWAAEQKCDTIDRPIPPDRHGAKTLTISLECITGLSLFVVCQWSPSGTGKPFVCSKPPVAKALRCAEPVYPQAVQAMTDAARSEPQTPADSSATGCPQDGQEVVLRISRRGVGSCVLLARSDVRRAIVSAGVSPCCEA